MVLNIEEMVIDIDKVSAIFPTTKHIVVDGTKVTILKNQNMDIIRKAFEWTHRSHMCDKNLKLTYGKGGK